MGDMSKRRPVTHLRIDSDMLGRGPTLWCQERTRIDARRNFDTTTDPTKVTCRRCIALGGCGPVKAAPPDVCPRCDADGPFTDESTRFGICAGCLDDYNRPENR